MSEMQNLVECTSWSRHHRSSPYEIEVTVRQESTVTIHGQVVEAVTPAVQDSMKSETLPAVPPWMNQGSSQRLEIEPTQDED